MAETESAHSVLAAAGLADVSRETIARLEAYVVLLRQWSTAQNLVGPSALGEIWTRHVADSAQLVAIAPDRRRWLDIGSGAGFPGMVTAILLADRPDATVHLVEGNARKAAFLREAARVTGAPARIHHGRIENTIPTWDVPIDAISARAVAAMAMLIGWIEPLLVLGIPAYLHKGLDFASEWADVPHADRFNLIQHRSRVGSGVIVEVSAKRAGDRSES